MQNSFGEVLQIGVNRLKAAGIADAERDANLLLQDLMNEDRNFIFLHRNDAIDEPHAEAYFEMLDRRAAGEPLQYITGTQEFMGCPFSVDGNVLIPRQDTETVVEFAIEEGRKKKRCSDILDMCCGSGAIAVSLAKAFPKASVTACDCSVGALEVARENAILNEVLKQIRFMQTDLFSVMKKSVQKPMKGTFDMIVCNPPYIPSAVIETLQTEVRDHEPRLALDGGADGLNFYRRIAADAAGHLKKQGIMILEIGHDQGEAVSALLRETGAYADIRVEKDLAGLDRIVYCSLL